ncbi:MAG: twin-arginine translocation signal domain-containing protein, partial [Thermoguttaceae bacterium]
MENHDPQKSQPSRWEVSRRGFLGQGLAAVAGASAVAAALSPLRHLTSDDLPTV